MGHVHTSAAAAHQTLGAETSFSLPLMTCECSLPPVPNRTRTQILFQPVLQYSISMNPRTILDTIHRFQRIRFSPCKMSNVKTSARPTKFCVAVSFYKLLLGQQWWPAWGTCSESRETWKDCYGVVWDDHLGELPHVIIQKHCFRTLPAPMPAGALALYRESRQILVSWTISVFSLCPVSHVQEGASSSIGLTEESTGSMQTANGATLLVNIGHVQRSQGNPDAALDTYKEARGLFKASGSWETPAGAACRSLIGVLSA